MRYNMKLVEGVTIPSTLEDQLDGREYKVVDAYIKFLGETIRFYPTNYSGELDEILYDDDHLDQPESEWLHDHVREEMEEHFCWITGWDSVFGKVDSEPTDEEFSDEEIEEMREIMESQW